MSAPGKMMSALRKSALATALFKSKLAESLRHAYISDGIPSDLANKK